MLNKVTNFFKNIHQSNFNHLTESLSLEMACTVLLCEVMRADHHFDHDEKNKIQQLIKNKFNLSDLEVNNIFDEALAKSEVSNDLYTYTSLINQNYHTDEKIALVQMLWQLALADGEIAPIEHHLIRKIADLLYLRHSEYIASKPINTP